MVRTDLVEHAMDRDHAAVSFGRVYFQIWAGACTMDAANGIERTLEQLVARYPDGIALMGISRPGVSVVPTPEVRHRLAAIFRRRARDVRCIATVIAGEGFIAATKRAVVTAIAMLARQSGPLKIFDTPTPAAQWMCEQLAGLSAAPTSAEVLLEALARIERSYDAFFAGG